VNAEMFQGSSVVGSGNALYVQGVSGGLVVAGGLTNNNATPSTNNVGALTAVATAAPETYTSTYLVAPTVTLGGSTRVMDSVDANAASIHWFSTNTAATGLSVAASAI